MALLVPLIKSNYSLYAPKSSLYVPSSQNHSARQEPFFVNHHYQSLLKGSSGCYLTTQISNRILASANANNKPKGGLSNSKSLSTQASSKYKCINSTSPTTIVVNGNIIYTGATGTNGKYIVPPGLVITAASNSISGGGGGNNAGGSGGGSRRFRSLSERSRVITPMPIIFENERLGSGPEMLYHPHTAPPVRKTRKSKSLPNETDQSIGGTTVDGRHKKKAAKASNTGSASDGCPKQRWFSSKVASAPKHSNCPCEACTCGCNEGRKRKSLFSTSSTSTHNDKASPLGKDHRHRTGCRKVVISADNTSGGNQSMGPASKLIAKASETLCERLISASNPVAPNKSQYSHRYSSSSSNSSNSSGTSVGSCESAPATPSPSPPNRSPLNSEIALAGKFAFAQLYHQHHLNNGSNGGGKHRRSHVTGSATPPSPPTTGTDNSPNKMVSLLRSLSEKLTLRRDGTAIGEDTLKDVADLTITTSTTTYITKNSNHRRPATLPGILLQLSSSPNLEFGKNSTAGGVSPNQVPSTPSLPFFKRFRTLSR